MSYVFRSIASLLIATASWSSPTAWAHEEGRPLSGSEWWQWALSVPAPVNPLLDMDGAQCMVGQRGSTWFLAGAFGSGTVTRKCQVPQDVRLFFPIANAVNIDTPGICGQGENVNISVAELRASGASTIKGLKRITATLDSKPLRPLRRIRSEVFALSLPADNLFNLPSACGAGAVPGKVYSRAVDDGIYAVVDDLEVGEHLLQFTATFADNTVLDVTYSLTVVRRDRR